MSLQNNTVLEVSEVSIVEVFDKHI
jgi:hypothetical protein